MKDEAIEGVVSRKSIFIIAIMLSGAFIAVLNQTVLSPALPSIMTDLNIEAGKGQWLTTAFMLVNGIMIPVTAYLINRFTTRQLFISSMAFFAVGTALAGVAGNFPLLMVARVLQAIGAGILMPMIQTVILLIFPKSRRGSAMGVIGIVMAFAPAIGPTLAGWIVDGWGWNMIFLLIAPIAALDILLAVFLLKNVGEPGDPKLDFRSVIYSTLGFGGLLYGSSSAGTYGWIHPLTYMPLIVGVVFLTVFVKRQLRLEEPLLEMRIFTNPAFTFSTIIGMILNAALISGTILTPIYLQNVLGFKAMQSGMIMLPGAILMGVMSPITGNLFDRFGPRGLAMIGLSIMTAASVCFVFFDEGCTFGYLCMIYTIRMFGISMVMMPLTTWGLNALENKFIAHGSAINNTMRQVAGSIGTSLLVTVMMIFTRSAARRGDPGATLYGIHMAFGVAAALSVTALLLCVFFVRREPRRGLRGGSTY